MRDTDLTGNRKVYVTGPTVYCVAGHCQEFVEDVWSISPGLRDFTLIVAISTAARFFYSCPSSFTLRASYHRPVR